jgi:hypothetical protein
MFHQLSIDTCSQIEGVSSPHKEGSTHIMTCALPLLVKSFLLHPF